MADASWSAQPRTMSPRIMARTAQRIGEHAAHHGAQRLLGQQIVADMVGHVTSVRTSVPMLALSRGKGTGSLF